MRWIKLTEEEARVCHAPREVCPVGALALSRLGRWQKDALFVILSAYFDESGMAQEQHLTVGGFVFNLAQLQRFNRRWNKLLDKSHIPYAHYTEMLAKEPPYFTDWNTHDVFLFYSKGMLIAQKHAILGVTVTIDKSLFEQHYKSRFDKTGGDSLFGLAARVIIQYLTGYFDKYAGVPDPHLNMIFDKQDQYGNAAKDIFYETKRLYEDGKRVLGDFSFGETREVCGLQMADFLAAFARQSEPALQRDRLKMTLTETSGTFPKAGERKRTPILHVPITEEAFDLFVYEQNEGLPRLRARQKWLKNQLKKIGKA